MPPFIRSIEAAIIADISNHIEQIENAKRDTLDELKAARSDNNRVAMRYSAKEYRRLNRDIALCNTHNSAHPQN